MFAITPSDIEHHIKECGRCAALKRKQRMGATPKTLESEIRKNHLPIPIAA